MVLLVLRGEGVFLPCAPPPSNQETIFKLFKWFVQWNHLVLTIHYFVGHLPTPPPQTIKPFLNGLMVCTMKPFPFTNHFKWIYWIVNFIIRSWMKCPPSNQQTIFKWSVQWNHLVLPIHYFIGPLHPPPQSIKPF